MADNKSTDSFDESALDPASDSSLTESSLADDPRGEELASDHLPEPDPSTEFPPDAEAEELEVDEALDEDDDAAGVVIDDEDQLADAEEDAELAVSTVPVRRRPNAPVKRAKGEAPAKKDAPTRKRRTATVTRTRKRTTPAQFVGESVGELRKVVWPTGAQLQQYFWTVLLFVLFIIAFVGLLDLLFGWVLLKTLG